MGIERRQHPLSALSGYIAAVEPLRQDLSDRFGFTAVRAFQRLFEPSPFFKQMREFEASLARFQSPLAAYANGPLHAYAGNPSAAHSGERYEYLIEPSRSGSVREVEVGRKAPEQAALPLNHHDRQLPHRSRSEGVSEVIKFKSVRVSAACDIEIRAQDPYDAIRKYLHANPERIPELGIDKKLKRGVAQALAREVAKSTVRYMGVSYKEDTLAKKIRGLSPIDWKRLKQSVLESTSQSHCA